MAQNKLSPTDKIDIIPLICLTLKFKGGEIVVERFERLLGPSPAGEITPGKKVPDSIIGHWVEMISADGSKLYRRYLQRRLPINQENAGSKLQKIYALEKYRILLPDLPEAHQLLLFEQSLPNADLKKPLKKQRLKLDLSAHTWSEQDGKRCLPTLG